MARMTRAERSARNKQAWAAAVDELQGTFMDASPRLGASKEERREARRVRQGARARRDSTWRAEAAAAIAAGSSTSGAGTGSGASGSTPSRPRRPGPARRQAMAIAASITATWTEARPPTRAERRLMNQEAWTQLQLARLDQTAAARTARRGARRQAHSQAWLAAQSARIQSAHSPADPRRDRS
jgi:hypothetical protein